ncbi:MAG: hypothetical protein WD355_07220 [Balneolaceae bacterium]
MANRSMTAEGPPVRRFSKEEGYVYNSYGPATYLKHVVASLSTLRRYDKDRPVALVCTDEHRQLLKEYQLTSMFDEILPIREEHASIVGFKHNLHSYMPFRRNLYLDSDIVWCRNPDPLWTSLSIYDFTITGLQVSDNFFGASKSFSVLSDILFQRRSRTLNRFGITQLSRVQSGMIYGADKELTRSICGLAADILSRKGETHFQSRLSEKGRNQESCEWSLAMAMAKKNLQVYPWHQGHESPQLDYLKEYTRHDPDFRKVECTFYCDPFVYSLRGLKSNWIRTRLLWLFSLFPGMGDYIKTTPYCLHFGWVHQKKPFFDFAERNWMRLTVETTRGTMA